MLSKIISYSDALVNETKGANYGDSNSHEGCRDRVGGRIVTYLEKDLI
jgi:hypothetical protein